jgi:4-hydroxy-3-methylbut-2-enyl diphosphate reductase
VLVQEVLARLAERFALTIEDVVVAEEHVTFKLPAFQS